MTTVLTPEEKTLASTIESLVASTPVVDIHTHLYDPAFGPLLLWGIDDLLVYHYLVAEAFRWSHIPYDKFARLPKREQADLIWKALFVQNSPVSEACRGILTTLHELGLDVHKRDLPAVRKWFAEWDVSDYTTHCLELARIKTVYMTNSPFDDLERLQWQTRFHRDSRFAAALRLDPVLLNWPETGRRLAEWGYSVNADLSPATIDSVRRFLDDWAGRIHPAYLMVSLPPEFRFPDASECCALLEKVILPWCRERGLPFAMMMGVKRAVNPALGLAGDAVGWSPLTPLENLCAAYPENKFLVTVLPRENQHHLCVAARKFRNLHIFGCWWFTNIPWLVEEITRMRLELLGLSFTFQHSDARILDQLIYKWKHARGILTRVLVDKYRDLTATAWPATSEEIQRDVKSLLGGSFHSFCQGH